MVTVFCSALPAATVQVAALREDSDFPPPCRLQLTALLAAATPAAATTPAAAVLSELECLQALSGCAFGLLRLRLSGALAAATSLLSQLVFRRSTLPSEEHRAVALALLVLIRAAAVDEECAEEVGFFGGHRALLRMVGHSSWTFEADRKSVV